MNKNLKKFLSIFLVVCFVFSSVFLGGCSIFDLMSDNSEYSSSGSGSSSGGDSGSSSGDEGSLEDLEGEETEDGFEQGNFVDYLSGLKVLFSNSEENEEYARLIMKEIKCIAAEILLSLSAEYGRPITTEDLVLPSNIEDNDVAGNAFLSYMGESYAPFMSYSMENNASLTIENMDNPITYPGNELSGDERINAFLPYTHECAIVGNNALSTDASSPEQAWKWTNEYLSSNMTGNEMATQFTFYSYNYLKLAIAIANIILGVDLTDTSANATYQSQINGGFNTLQDNLLSLCKTIQRTGVEKKEFEPIIDFIKREVIGSEIVAYDDTNFDIYENGLYRTDGSGEFHNEEFLNITDVNQVYYYLAVGQGQLGDEFAPFYHDLNMNGEFDFEQSNLCVRRDYFKNYSNTVSEIINRVITRVDEEDNPVYVIAYLLKMTDLRSTDIQWVVQEAKETINNNDNEDETEEQKSEKYDVMTLPTQYQNYKNLILMFKKNTNLETLWLGFDAEQDFTLNVFVRYYNASKECYMTWFQEDNQFADDDGFTDTLSIGSVRVKAGDYSAGEWFGEYGGDISIDFKKILIDVPEEEDSEEEEILPSPDYTFNPNFDGERNDSTIISPFANNNPSFDEVQEFMSYDTEFYDYQNSDYGVMMNYKDITTSFIEILFTSSNDTPFRIGFMDIGPLK